MHAFDLLRILRSRYGLAGTAGLLLAAAFPTVGVASLGWIAPGLMVMSALGQSAGLAFRLGYVAGLAFYLGSLSWLLLIPFPVGAMAGWLSLSAYLALYPAAWVWLSWRGFPVKGVEQTAESGIGLRWAEQFLCSTWQQRVTWSLTSAALWVALEILRARFLTGFPWNPLGASQYSVLPLIQICAWTGVYGISFLMVWFSLALASAVAVMIRRPTERWGWLGELILPLLVLLGVLGFGFRQLGRPAAGGRTLNVALIQPSIPQSLIWDAQASTNRFYQLLQLSRQALAHTQTDLLVWPESAVPNVLRYDPELTYPAITNLVRTYKVWLILQADDLDERRQPGRPVQYDWFNSSFLFSPDGQMRATYRKQRLVIFGEYIPLTRWLPFLKWFTPIEGGFTPGTGPVPFPMPELEAKTSVLICFEDMFPHLVRDYVQADTDFLLNLTSDAWFGRSAAQWQHAANALFRAVENGLPLVRCTNNGLTCWVDSTGRLHEVAFDDSPDIYQAGFKTAQIPLLPAGRVRRATFYNRNGDWFGWACVGVVFLAGLGQWSGRRRFFSLAPAQKSSHITPFL